MRETTTTQRRFARWVTFVSLMVWGAIHVAGGVALLTADTTDGLRTLGSRVADSVPLDPGSAASGLLQFHGLNIALAGAAVAILAVSWFRSGVRWRLDVSLAVAIGFDIGLILFLVLPGLLPPSEGLIGPALALIALVASIGLRRDGDDTAVTRTRRQELSA